MQERAKHVLAVLVLALSCWGAPCHASEQVSTPVLAQSTNPPSSCMRRLWRDLLPVVAANSGYIVVSDVQRIAQIKLREPVAVGPADVISSYEMKGPYALSPSMPGSLLYTGNANLSLRLELHSEPATSSFPYSWQRMQRRINGTKSSNFDLTCLDGGAQLSLKEAESDLEAIGLRRVGTLTQPKTVEVFDGGLKGRVDLYYETPVELAPEVVSIHVAGADIKRMPTEKKSL
jgi:hypothetical protein